MEFSAQKIRFIPIEKGEGKLISLLYLHAFLMGMALIFYKTTTTALFITQHNSDALPLAYIGSAFLVPLLGWAYARIHRYFSINTLFISTLLILALYVSLFRLVLGWSGASIFSMLGLICLEPLYTFFGLEFWGLTGQLLNNQQGKRLFSFIGSGTIVANIIGGLSIGFLNSYMGQIDLLWISVISILLCMVILRKIKHLSPLLQPVSNTAETKTTKHISDKNKRYLNLIYFNFMVTVITYYLVDYLFYQQVEMRYTSSSETAVFLGQFFAATATMNLIMRLFVAGPLISRYGITTSFLILPICLTVGIAASIFFFYSGNLFLVFWCMVMTKWMDQSVRFSIYVSSLQLTYQPLPANERIIAQSRTESLGAFAGGVGLSLILFFKSDTFIQFLNTIQPSEVIVILTFLTLGLWTGILWKFGKAYSQFKLN